LGLFVFMEISRLTAVYDSDTTRFERGNSSVQRGISTTESHLNKAGRSAQGFWSNMASNALANIATNLLQRVAGAVKDLALGSIKSAADFDALKRGLAAISGSSEEAERQFVRLREVAKLPGLGFREAIQGSLRLQAVGFSATQSERALKAFGNAVAFTGGGKSELERITVQLGQMAGKSKVLSQDLRPIIESAPAVGKALKEAFGTVDTEQLQELGLTNAQFLEMIDHKPKVTMVRIR
jgi:tape measure domain-containing protein